MISVSYNEQMVEKARRVVALADQLPHPQRNDFCTRVCGLTYDYLRRLGKSFKRPSARTILNLGFELYVKDLDSGEFSRLELDVPCDYNPSNPRMNPRSMAIFTGERLDEYSTSE